MKKQFYKTLEEVPVIVLKAYDEGNYKFNPPPVCHALWDKLAWINWVVFSDEVIKNS